MTNLISDSQFFRLSDFLTIEASLPSVGVTYNVVSNGFNSVQSLFGITSFSNIVYFRKESSAITKDSIKIEQINKENINLSLLYSLNDTVSTVRKIYFPIDNEKFDPKQFIDKWFTLDIDIATSFSNISNVNLDFEIVLRDSLTEHVLQKQSLPIYYNANFNVSAHSNFKKFKNSKISFKTLKTNSFDFKDSAEDFSSYGAYLAVSLPTSASSYSIYLSNIFLSLGKNSEKNFLDAQSSKLKSRQKIESSKALIKDAQITNDLSVARDSTVQRDHSVTRDLMIFRDFLVYGISKLGSVIQFYNSDKTQLYGSITKSSQNGLIVFQNSNGSRAELEALSIRSRLADLAEYHICHTDVSEGHLVQVSKSNKYDIEKCTNIKNLVGVVSTDPALKMNTSLLDLKSSDDFSIMPIGYIGIIPVKIYGKIKKGDYVTVHKEYSGYGKKSMFRTKIVALENSNNENKVNFIKCLVQV